MLGALEMLLNRSKVGIVMPPVRRELDDRRDTTDDGRAIDSGLVERAGL